MSLVFELSEEQNKKAQEWLESHACSMKRFIEKTGRRPALGERARFIFVPTMMGTASMVQCNCGKHLDLTDYSEW